MYGFSYVGFTQLSAALGRPPHLTCISPAMTGSQCYEGWAYEGGAMSLALDLSWAVELSTGEAHRRHLDDLERELWNAFMHMRDWYGYLPLSDIPILKDCKIAPYFFDWLDHPIYDQYWKQWSIDLRWKDISVPCLFTGGWYDAFRDGTLRNFAGIGEFGGDEKPRGFQKLLMGPWYHVPWAPLTGQMDFGEEARNIVSEDHLRWFDYWLKGIENGISADPPVRLFVMGKDIWREEESWPPRGVRNSEFYFHSVKGANSLNGDGTLDRSVPTDEPPDLFVYNPRSPVPSLGGHSCCFPTVSPMGPFDQREVELQNQVLVYTSGPLEEGILVAGPVTARLWATSSAVDTDFTVKLMDVYPDGRAMNLTEGIVRARYRISVEKPLLLTPGEVYEFQIQVGNTCNYFSPGHRIRVEVSSSNFPHWDRNTNSGNDIGKDGFSELCVATQVIFHDAQRPSHLSLPIIVG
jgi:putative CocE/NonD family hydrolase